MIVYLYMVTLFTAHHAILTPLDIEQIMEIVDALPEESSTNEAMCDV
jgi:hypothetical protein